MVNKVYETQLFSSNLFILIMLLFKFSDTAMFKLFSSRKSEIIQRQVSEIQALPWYILYKPTHADLVFQIPH